MKQLETSILENSNIFTLIFNPKYFSLSILGSHRLQLSYLFSNIPLYGKWWVIMSGLRGDVKINWLQPPYSAASCSQLIYGMLYVALECCSILAAASSYEF